MKEEREVMAVVKYWEKDSWEGRFKRKGTYVYLWLIHVDIWRKTTQYIKQYPQIKNKYTRKIKTAGASSQPHN